MKILTLIRSEFARLTSSRLGIAALIALMTVPIAYGGLYLWGNQDPQGNLDRVPAALVVEDAGTTADGKAVNYGRDTANQLEDDQKFGWVEVSQAAAIAGVKKGTFDFALTFPATFSADLTSAADNSPTRAALDLTTSDTNSYLSTSLAKQGAEAVRVVLARTVGAKASRTLLNAVADVRAGLVSASDGAAKLATGAKEVDSGAADLSAGLAQLASGASTLSGGNAQVSSGAAAIAAGLATLKSQSASLPAATSALNTGATKVATGLASASAGASALVSPAAQAASLSPSVRAQLADAFAASDVPAATQAQILAQMDGLSQLTAGVKRVTASLAPRLAALSTGANQVKAGAATLAAKAPALVAGIGKAASSENSLAAGAKETATGAATLSSKLATASTGAAKVAAGVDTLSTGATKLSTSLAKGVKDVPATTAAERARTATAIANPVTVRQTAITTAQNYGAGLAPFFLGLSAWIGMYALFLLVRPLSRRALTAVRRPIATALAGWATPAILGVVQMVALFLVTTLVLHMTAADPLGLLAFLVLVSVTFAAIILVLNVWLGSVGQFLGLLLMIIQLVTAGGTFPWQTLPGPLAAVHRALPMSHAVEGIRQLLYGGTGASIWAAVFPLLLWLVGSLAVAALGALRQGRFRSLRQLRPSPIGA